MKLGHEAIGLLGPTPQQRLEETVDPGVDRPELLGVVALDSLQEPASHLLDGGAAQMRGEPQQILSL